MTRNDLTDLQKRRFDKNRICPLCNQVIDVTDKILFIKRRYGRCKHYTFYHERCLYGKQKEKKENQRAEEN